MSSKIQTITLGGGCFWCTEAIFNRVKGVAEVVSGYAGGDYPSPSYEDVTSGATGHAESIQIKYDPGVVSLETLLEIFFVTHDPTQLNRQGNDVGTQYRSIIFYHTEKQHSIIKEAIKNAQMEHDKRIVTQVVPFKEFYTAEGYHQKYYDNNKNNNPYCSIVIDPKIQKLLRKFSENVREEYIK